MPHALLPHTSAPAAAGAGADAAATSVFLGIASSFGRLRNLSIFFSIFREKKIEFARNFYMALSSAEKEHLARVLAQDRQALIFNDFEVRGGEERAQP